MWKNVCECGCVLKKTFSDAVSVCLGGFFLCLYHKAYESVSACVGTTLLSCDFVFKYDKMCLPDIMCSPHPMPAVRWKSQMR